MLKKILCQTHPTLESMVVEVDAIFNSCPLTYVSPDTDNMEPIMPAHLVAAWFPYHIMG